MHSQALILVHRKRDEGNHLLLRFFGGDRFVGSLCSGKKGVCCMCVGAVGVNILVLISVCVCIYWYFS